MSKVKIQVEFKGGHLLPITGYDAELLEDYAQGSVFNLTSTGKRSNPHHNMYWSILRSVCRATGKWPKAEKLHDDLKWACGYVTMRYNTLSGEYMRSPDSISFDEMTQEEFNQYFEMAMATLAENLGYDPVHEQFGK